MVEGSAASGPSIVVHPRHAVFTGLGKWLVRLSLPSALILLLAENAALDWIGVPDGNRPLAVRILLVAIALAPAAFAICSPMLVRLHGFDWFFVRPQPLAVVGREGLDLRLPRLGTQHFEWERIGSLRFRRAWNGGSELHSPDGELLATVPDELVHPKVYWRTAFTLAESVVQAMPDRYALSQDRPSLGRPASFDLRERVGSGIDYASWERRRGSVLIVILAGLTLLGAIPAILLLSR